LKTQTASKSFNIITHNVHSCK